MNWELRRICTPEEIFTKINKEMPHPLGIVIFGVDYKRKKELSFMFSDNIKDLPCSFSAAGAAMLFSHGLNCMVEMSEDCSCCHSERHDVVKQLRKAGAKTVIGVYVKIGPEVEHEGNEFYNQVKRLTDNPPTAEGLDYFIVVED